MKRSSMSCRKAVCAVVGGTVARVTRPGARPLAGMRGSLATSRRSPALAGTRGRVLAMAVVAAPAVVVGAASTASAGEAVLWACHGPSGQPLGSQPLTAATLGDGVAGTYGAGCASSVTAIGDGGLRAAFPRTDPAGGSQASWRLDVPSGVALEAARIARSTTGFGGTPAPDGAQSYVAQTSNGVLETASVEDATNLPLDGVLDRDPAAGAWVRFGVVCSKRQLERCVPATGDPLGVQASSIALRVGDDDAPRGAVGDVSSPAAGTLSLSLLANDIGLGLASARATLDGALAATADLGGPSCAELSPQDATIDLAADAGCRSSASGVPLAVDTTRVADGTHRLAVVVRDAAGNETTVADEQVVVRNAAPQTTSQVALTLGTGSAPLTGGGGTATGAPGGGAGGVPAGGPACAVPQLSMMLRSRPLRTFRGVPVLSPRLAYRFAGRLTCVTAGRRAAAPKGTVVEILSVVGKRIRSDGGVTVMSRGAISVLLRYRSSRIVRFRHRSADGTSARVSIRIAVAHPVVRHR